MGTSYLKGYSIAPNYRIFPASCHPNQQHRPGLKGRNRFSAEKSEFTARYKILHRNVYESATGVNVSVGATFGSNVTVGVDVLIGVSVSVGVIVTVEVSV
ncbi:MAG: hypothetical protein CVU39_10670 [Chloroflexi bacterium HGW-Chloroflexi-10]|nr:MAG: hypothetical protein CVU39_10670 [Chloroflexi bacterium HGW-Chloroflexi-10]